MPITKPTDPYILTAGGGTINLPTTDTLAAQYSVSGTATLAGSWVIQASGTAYADQVYSILWTAALTLSGNNVTIFGRVLTQQEALKKMQIICRYNSLTAAWEVYFIPTVDVTGRFYHGVTTTTVPAGGGTVTLNPATSKGFQVYNSGAGSVTLTSNYTITAGGTPQEGDEFYVLWSGTVIADGNTVTIFGETLSDSQILNGGVLFHVVYNGSAWVVLEGATVSASSIVSKSYSQLQTMVAASSLQVNTVYFVNDRNIWIKAIEANRFELQGSFKMLCPDYQDVSGLFGGVWISTMALPAIGDLYSYNNFMWENLTGAVGTAPSGDAVNWLCKGTYGSGTWKDWVNKTGSYYVTEIYACEYDFTNDWVQLLHDVERGNKIGGSYQYEQTISNGFNVIDKFQWGRDTQKSNTAIEAYLNNVNTTGTYTGNTLPAGGELVLAVALSSNLLAVTNANTQDVVYKASLSIPTASVLTLNATPLEIVAAPGAGYAIECINASLFMTYNSVAYATNTTLQLITDTATVAQMQLSGAISNTVTRGYKIPELSSAAGTTSTQVIENKSLKVSVATGNPTAGNSDITVYVTYRIITL